MRRRGVIVVVASAAVIVAAGAGLAVGLGGDDDAADRPITGPTLARASAAALAHTGGGRVTGTEAGDEESAYEVEVTLPDGTEVDVQLDADLRVVGSETDGPGGED